MTYSKFFALGTMAAGLLLGSAAAQAQDRYGSDGYRYGYGDRSYSYGNRGDNARVQRLRERIAADHYRLEQNRRRGHWRAAERDARDLDRHQHELERLLRELRYDRAEGFRDRRW
jgi:hypothetical protein